MIDIDGPDLVERVTAFMHAHLDEPMTIDMVCEGVRCPKARLIAAIRVTLRTSPMAYLKSLRLAEARSKLQDVDSGNLRVFELAALCGFWHLGHFSRAYRAAFGETPSQTRLKARATERGKRKGPTARSQGLRESSSHRAWQYAMAEH